MRMMARLVLLAGTSALLVLGLGSFLAEHAGANPPPAAALGAAVVADSTPSTSPAPGGEPAAPGSAGTLNVSGRELAKVPGDWLTRLTSFAGMLLIIAVALAGSSSRRHVNWMLVLWGLGLQFTFALFIFQPVWMSVVLLAVLVLVTNALRSSDEELWQRMKRPVATAVPVPGALLAAWLALPSTTAAPETLSEKLSATLFGAPMGRAFFDTVNSAVMKLLAFTEEGSNFLLRSMATGELDPALANFVFQVLPTIIFFSALMTVLYHLGIMQVVVRAMARVMQRTMGTSGAESMSSAANIFVGQTEAPLVIKPYVADMTRSELMAVMTGGFATVAGGVLAAYVGMLKGYFPNMAGHLMAASIMNAPAGLVCAKLLVPETSVPLTSGTTPMEVERVDANVIGAAARGASEGMTLVLNVAAMLLAFIALIAGLNYLIGLVGAAQGSRGAMLALTLVLAGGAAVYFYSSTARRRRKLYAVAGVGALVAASWLLFAARGPQPLELSLQIVFGTLLKPVAFLLGVPWEEAAVIGGLLGEKLVLNEFFAFAHLGQMLQSGTVVLSERAVTIATYAMLGFANLASIAIQIGGIGGIAPTRRQDLARLGLRAMLAGTMAAYLSACVASILIP